MNVFKHFPQFLSFFFLAGIIIGCQSCKPEKTETNYKYNDNTVRVRLPAEPTRINPILEPSSTARMVFDHVYMELADFDPESLELVPLLIKNDPIITNINDGELKGGTAFTYEIRDEAVWDDGTPVTGADVDFSIKTLFAPGIPPYLKPYYDYVKKIEIDPTNPKKFTVFANRKYIVAEDAISNTVVYQASHFDPKGYMKKFSIGQLNGPDAAKLNENSDLKAFVENFLDSKYSLEVGGVRGCGPYKYAGRVAEQYILLTKKDNWWGEKFAANSPQMQAYPDTLIFKIIKDQTATITALKDQEIDVATGIDSKDFTDLKTNDLVTSIFNLQNPPTGQIFWINLNTKLPKLADPRVRKALAHLMDVDEFLKTLYYGFGKRINGPVLETEPYYNKDLPLIPYDIEKAKSLLADAGWKDIDNDGILEKDLNGTLTKLELNMLISSSKAAENIALFYQNEMKKAGIKMNINQKPNKEVFSLVRKGEFELYPGAVVMDQTSFDPKEHWHTTSFVSNGGRNYSGFGDAMSDALIDSIRVTLDEEKRHQLYRVFQEKLYEQTPVIFLFNPLNRMAMHKRFDMKMSAKRPGFHPNTFKLKEE